MPAHAVQDAEPIVEGSRPSLSPDPPPECMAWPSPQGCPSPNISSGSDLRPESRACRREMRSANLGLTLSVHDDFLWISLHRPAILKGRGGVSEGQDGDLHDPRLSHRGHMLPLREQLSSGPRGLHFPQVSGLASTSRLPRELGALFEPGAPLSPAPSPLAAWLAHLLRLPSRRGRLCPLSPPETTASRAASARPVRDGARVSILCVHRRVGICEGDTAPRGRFRAHDLCLPDPGLTRPVHINTGISLTGGSLLARLPRAESHPVALGSAGVGRETGVGVRGRRRC